MNGNRWGSVLRTSVSLALAFAGSVGSAVAQYLPTQPPTMGYPSAAISAYPADPARYPGTYSYGRSAVRPSQDVGTVSATLPPEYQPEGDSAQDLSPQFRRTVVDYHTIEPPSTITLIHRTPTFT